MDLDVIWQVHLLGSVTHCVIRKERFGVEPPVKHAAASPMLSPGDYKRGAISLFAKLLLVLVKLMEVFLCG